MYKTRDLNLIAFLRYKGFTIKDIEEGDRGMMFSFEDSEELQKTITGFFADEKEIVAPRKLLLELRETKNLIYRREPSRI